MLNLDTSTFINLSHLKKKQNKRFLHFHLFFLLVISIIRLKRGVILNIVSRIIKLQHFTKNPYTMWWGSYLLLFFVLFYKTLLQHKVEQNCVCWWGGVGASGQRSVIKMQIERQPKTINLILDLLPLRLTLCFSWKMTECTCKGWTGLQRGSSRN